MYVSNVLSCGDSAFTNFGDYEEEKSKEEEAFDRDVTGTVSGSLQTR